LCVDSHQTTQRPTLLCDHSPDHAGQYWESSAITVSIDVCHTTSGQYSVFLTPDQYSMIFHAITQRQSVTLPRRVLSLSVGLVGRWWIRKVREHYRQSGRIVRKQLPITTGKYCNPIEFPTRCFVWMNRNLEWYNSAFILSVGALL
jgi:hypothetical protein